MAQAYKTRQWQSYESERNVKQTLQCGRPDWPSEMVTLAKI